MSKYVIEGWIKAKLEYPQSIEGYVDSDQYYFAEHSKFGPTKVNKDIRIKYFRYDDSETELSYFVTFGYEEVGVKFTASISASEAADTVAIFLSLLTKAISGYSNLKNFFLNNISPKEQKIGFAEGLSHLLIAPYGFFRGLNKRQQKTLVKKTEEIMKKYSANAYIVCKGDRSKEKSVDTQIEIKTLKDLEEEAKYDFIDATIAWGDFYLYVDHFLMRGPLSSLDPSLSLNTVAYGGFLSSLVLQDIHYELKDLGSKMANLRSKIDLMIKKTFPSSVDFFKEELTRLEKTYAIVSSDLHDYSSLSNKIYESLENDEESQRLIPFLRQANSLPDSLFIAENVLELNRQEYFSTFERELVDLRSNVSIVDLRFNRTEIGITVIVLISLAIAVSISTYYYHVRIDQIADFIGILTFGIALTLLVLRILPKRQSSIKLKGIWKKIKSRFAAARFFQLW